VEQASVVFLVAFAFQSVGVMIMWAQIVRNNKRIEILAEYLELLSTATATHVKRIDETITKEKVNA
jgi:hypothetical protein